MEATQRQKVRKIRKPEKSLGSQHPEIKIQQGAGREDRGKIIREAINTCSTCHVYREPRKIAESRPAPTRIPLTFQKAREHEIHLGQKLSYRRWIRIEDSLAFQEQFWEPNDQGVILVEAYTRGAENCSILSSVRDQPSCVASLGLARGG